ncbi:sigma-70 family RNA polymerase sigma factor [Sphingobacterium alkalisoli]|uniref:Sigma-70 family RNA polymerase sigma factor n=1 Tax=Sphingobacterium alkalisoli TaxID=1874115 RepID=A0A4U0H9A1_9SPHI|nr:sigma-70 family RNA polymerase sigma factor [Sphingobacterium alkalisoli]TJY68411.1 sigma-70 family RNA polymerase sigma factor [Sphingobacterium alkalisoli]GGH06686.1 DNA-directed RNA polymerase sigma-70 factor [Sphingobacterium alkalisoli]
MAKLDLQSTIRGVIAGSDSAFRELFDAYRPNIYTTALRITNNEWMAEDIVQDTFVKVWMSREELTNVTNFEGWLYVIAKNITFNILKKQKNYKAYFLAESKEALLRVYPEADYMVQDKEFQLILQQAIDRLPPKQQQTYKLIKELQLKRDEAATELNVSPETVKWNLEQAMKSIRAYCMVHLKDLPIVVVLHLFSKYF